MVIDYLVCSLLESKSSLLTRGEIILSEALLIE